MASDLEQVHAKLALALGAEAAVPVGEAPSLEELAALADAQLGATRRAQVISHIVADENLYAQWVALQDALLYVDGERQPETAPAPERASLFARLGAWLHTPGFVGAATAMLVVALVVPSIRPDYSRGVDRLYEDAQPVSLAESRGVGQMGRLDRGSALQFSTTRQLLQAGAQSGLESIASGQGLPGLRLDQLQQLSLMNRLGLLRPSWRARFELGRLTAIATLQCHANIAGTDFGTVISQYADIREVLAGREGLSEWVAVEQIFAALDQVGDDYFRACLAASRGLAFLRSKPE